jgi:4-diphosphocytidyl-2-C-methyl-D-erythritol kinase
MISFPPCKINLGLNIVRKRNDGYHDIETCFMPVAWCDVLEIIPSKKTEIHQTGILIAGDAQLNIVYKAYVLLQRDFSLPPVAIHLHKVIPHGAGLGGGSSDAAFTLHMLNRMFALTLSQAQLHDYALQLGSDCPCFLHAAPMLGSGRGEVLEPIALPLSGKYITLIKPNVQVSTAEAYQGIRPAVKPMRIREVMALPVQQWRNHLFNDFEESIFDSHPDLAKIKQDLYNAGALYASMSGSGSTVYGIFDVPFEGATLYPERTCWSGQIRFDKLAF